MHLDGCVIFMKSRITPTPQARLLSDRRESHSARLPASCYPFAATTKAALEHRAVVEGCLSVDVRRWHRNGWLNRGQGFPTVLRVDEQSGLRMDVAIASHDALRLRVPSQRGPIALPRDNLTRASLNRENDHGCQPLFRPRRNRVVRDPHGFGAARPDRMDDVGRPLAYP